MDSCHGCCEARKAERWGGAQMSGNDRIIVYSDSGGAAIHPYETTYTSTFGEDCIRAPRVSAIEIATSVKSIDPE